MANKQITVVVMTYNHEDYIERALDSILSQKIDIDFDILIHDDCSDDGTYEILLKYQKQYSDRIKIIHQQRRMFPNEGFNLMIYNHVIPNIYSKYVAYCDGDDYWCDDLKLQKQYLFMEENRDYSMCFHCAYQLRQNGDLSSKWFIRDEGDIGLEDLINENPGIPIATSSLFVKADVFKNFSDWRRQYCVEDLPLYMTASLHGKIHRLKDVMCVYRQFSVGSWSFQNKNNKDRLISHQKDLINSVLRFDEQTKFEFHDLVKKHINGCEFRIALLSRDYKTVFSGENKLFVKRLPKRDRLSLKLQYRVPFLYNLIHKKKKDNHL